jgi:hypothetical protein
MITVTLPMDEYQALVRGNTPRPSNQDLRNLIIDRWTKRLKAAGTQGRAENFRAAQDLAVLLEQAINEALP